MRWDVIFYSVVSLVATLVPIVGAELQVAALGVAIWLSFLAD